MRPLGYQVGTHVQTHVGLTAFDLLLLIWVCARIELNKLRRINCLVLAHLRHSCAVKTLVHDLPLMRVIPARWRPIISKARLHIHLLRMFLHISWLQRLEVALVGWKVLTVDAHTQQRWLHYSIAVISATHTLVLTWWYLLVVIRGKTSLIQWQQHLWRCSHRHDGWIACSQPRADLLDVV